MAAPIASGSFKADGIIVVPCSMKTLAAIHSGFCDDLISRTADVMLKERRKLVLVARETPLSDVHLRNMLEVSRAGAVIFPPVPAYYIRAASVDDLVSQSVGRIWIRGILRDGRDGRQRNKGVRDRHGLVRYVRYV